MRARTWARLSVGILALWGAAAALAWWLGVLRVEGRQPDEPARTTILASPPSAAAPADPPVDTNEPSAITPAPAPLKRHRLCVADAELSLLRIPATPRPRYLVHCGASVELLGFDEVAGAIAPRRIGHFEVNVPEPGLGAEAGGLASGDLDADGINDLIIGSLLRDDRGTLGGGRLHWIRGTPDGGFAAAKRIADVPAVALSWLRTDPKAHPELLALGAAEPRRGEASKLWRFAAGSTPRLRDTTQLAGLASQLDVVDLDLDGQDEAFALVGAPAALHRIRVGEPTVSSVLGTLSTEAARELHVAEMTGDDANDLVVVLGDKVLVLAAKEGDASDSPAPPSQDANALRDLHRPPPGTDPGIALVGYAHPDLVALVREADGLGRRVVYQRRSERLGTRNLRADNLDADADLELLLFGTTPDAPGVVELIVIPAPDAPEALESVSEELEDAPLSLRGNLP